MWDTIEAVLTGENGLSVLIFLLIFVIIAVFLIKTGFIRINTNFLQLGDDYRERAIIQQQTEWAHIYLQGLSGQIDELCKELKGYDPYVTKYILERMYGEVVDWITYNHINLESDYISIKQDKIRALVASLAVMPEYFASSKFLTKCDRWTDEIIRKLVKIREVYK